MYGCPPGCIEGYWKPCWGMYVCCPGPKCICAGFAATPALCMNVDFDHLSCVTPSPYTSSPFPSSCTC